MYDSYCVSFYNTYSHIFVSGRLFKNHNEKLFIVF